MSEHKTVEVIGDVDTVVRSYTDDLRTALERVDQSLLSKSVTVIVDALKDRHAVFLAGNGGSAAAASHLAMDWTNACRSQDLPTRAINLAESAGHISAIANDEGYEEIFARQLAFGSPDEVLLLLSVSGESRNLVRAAEVARERGMRVVGLLGRRGSLSGMCTTYVELGGADYGICEDLHIMFNHIVVRVIRGGFAHRWQSSATRT